jgi:hypothetical protein
MVDRSGSVLSPAAVQGDELVAHLGGQGLRLNVPEGGDRNPHLLEVTVAVRASGQVSLEASTILGRQSSFEVVGDELDSLPADDIPAAKAQPHGSGLPQLGFEEAAELGPAAVQEHPLVGFADPKHPAHLLGG